jgi:hypothetical protein
MEPRITEPWRIFYSDSIRMSFLLNPLRRWMKTLLCLTQPTPTSQSPHKKDRFVDETKSGPF